MKMQLGDMEMDTESGISYGEEQQAQNSAPQRTDTEDQRDSDRDTPTVESDTSDGTLDPDILNWVDDHTSVFHAATGLGLTGSAAAWYFFAVTAHPVFALAGLFALIWAATSGFLVYRARRHDPLDPQARRLRYHATQIRDILLDQPREWRAEELQRELDWSKQKVLSALAHGVDEGMIREDLDADSGHWVYTASTATLEEDVPERTLPAAERAERIRETRESNAQ